MFVKLLALLISNIFVSFSVLVCCRSLARIYGLKDGIEQRTNMVPVSALEGKGAALEREDTRSSVPTLKPKEPEIERTALERKIHDRVHATSATYPALP